MKKFVAYHASYGSCVASLVEAESNEEAAEKVAKHFKRMGAEEQSVVNAHGHFIVSHVIPGSKTREVLHIVEILSTIE